SSPEPAPLEGRSSKLPPTARISLPPPWASSRVAIAPGSEPSPRGKVVAPVASQAVPSATSTASAVSHTGRGTRRSPRPLAGDAGGQPSGAVRAGHRVRRQPAGARDEQELEAAGGELR